MRVLYRDRVRTLNIRPQLVAAVDEQVGCRPAMNSKQLREQVEALHPATFAWAVTCCQGHQVEAEEVLQTSYLKLLQGKARYRGESGLKTWLFAVVRNTARELERRQRFRRVALLRRAPELYHDGDRARCATDNMESEEVEQLRRALRDLPTRQQEIMHLVFYEAMTIAAASEVMGISVGSARTHYQRAKSNDKRHLLQIQGTAIHD